ncbi:MAG: hypothetical protein E7627_03375 [Ruminococcaceae bacterium]|nr:hypothetical protein [Oscillospiraceae bacterium]
MKKIISLMLALVFVCVAFASCGQKKHDDFLTVNYDYDLSEYIELGNYKGIHVVTNSYSVDEEFYVKIQVESSLSYYARTVEVDRAAQTGDTVYINSKATIDGASFEGGTTSNYPLVLGSDTIGKEFENNLVGLSAGGHVEFDISVPDEETELAELRGKTVHYVVDILKVCGRELPEYTDAFVKAYLGYPSIEAYEQSIIDALKENYQQNVYKSIIPQAWEQLVSTTTVIKYPEKELKEKYENLVAGVQDYANVKGLTLAQCVRAVFDMTEDEFYAYAQTEAENDVMEEMICYAVARAENLTLTNEEFEKRALDIAKNVYGLESVEQLEEKYDIETIKKGVLIDMAKQKIADYCEIEYTAPGSVIVPDAEHDPDHEGEN